jgi:hypothetical protein
MWHAPLRFVAALERGVSVIVLALVGIIHRI